MTTRGLRIVAANAGHAHLVACNMRERDRAEISASNEGKPVEAVILEALAGSPSYASTMFYGLEVLAIYGLGDLRVLGGAAVAWCFGTTAIDRHPLVFARASVRGIRDMHARCPVLTNIVDITDAQALRWLEFLGATYALQPRNLGGKLFQQFILARPGGEKRCRQG